LWLSSTRSIGGNCFNCKPGGRARLGPIRPQGPAD
jgi:hypothetical protein